jgi:hypothetical protein
MSTAEPPGRRELPSRWTRTGTRLLIVMNAGRFAIMMVEPLTRKETNRSTDRWNPYRPICK